MAEPEALLLGNVLPTVRSAIPRHSRVLPLKRVRQVDFQAPAVSQLNDDVSGHCLPAETVL